MYMYCDILSIEEFNLDLRILKVYLKGCLYYEYRAI